MSRKFTKKLKALKEQAIDSECFAHNENADD